MEIAAIRRFGPLWGSARRNLTVGVLALLLLTGMAALLSACNTVHGMGQDIENASDAVKKAL